MYFWFKSSGLLAGASLFCFFKAIFPFIPIPRMWSMHSLSTKLATEYFELHYKEKS